MPRRADAATFAGLITGLAVPRINVGDALVTAEVDGENGAGYGKPPDGGEGDPFRLHHGLHGFFRRETPSR